MAQGKCWDMDPAIFFPSDSIGVAEAQRICTGCPVKATCLEYALGNRIAHGVWGVRPNARVNVSFASGKSRHGNPSTSDISGRRLLHESVQAQRERTFVHHVVV